MRMRKASAESGQVGTWPVLAVALGILALAVFGFVRLATGVKEAAEIRTAADAAALAGAQAIGSDAPGRIISALNNGSLSLDGGLGQNRAIEFAGRNGSDVTFYRYYPVQDRVEVSVRSQQVTESGQRENASATASVGIRLGPCSYGTPPPPTPTPTPSPTPSPTGTPTPTPAPPPPDEETTGTCGELPIRVTWPGDGGEPVFAINANAAWLKDRIKPRLSA